MAKTKLLARTGLVAAAAMLIAAVPLSQDAADSRLTTISVTGQGYDAQQTATVTIGAATGVFDTSASRAVAENARITARLREQLRRLRVDESDFRTGAFTMQQTLDPEDRGDDRDHGFQVGHQLSITLRDPSKAGPVIDALVSAGATGLTFADSTWNVDPSPEAARSARREAVADALARARDYATALNMKVRRVVTLQDRSVSVTHDPVPITARVANPTQIGISDQTVQASVALVVELEPRR